MMLSFVVLCFVLHTVYAADAPFTCDSIAASEFAAASASKPFASQGAADSGTLLAVVGKTLVLAEDGVVQKLFGE